MRQLVVTKEGTFPWFFILEGVCHEKSEHANDPRSRDAADGM